MSPPSCIIFISVRPRLQTTAYKVVCVQTKICIHLPLGYTTSAVYRHSIMPAGIADADFLSGPPVLRYCGGVRGLNVTPARVTPYYRHVTHHGASRLSLPIQVAYKWRCLAVSTPRHLCATSRHLHTERRGGERVLPVAKPSMTSSNTQSSLQLGQRLWATKDEVLDAQRVTAI